MRKTSILIALLLLCLGVAAAGGLVNARSVGTWYADLQKPAWTPPGWLFAPVWTVLYAAMAVAAWLVWTRNGARAAALLMFPYLAWVTFATALNFAIWRLNL
ncbi:MAG: tryptophan-rich sensory protein [Candidatus Brocadiaceae bacterium]|nr:tryptophan-rich sensory protein [Candidatus Brocadiaceae bacterium]